MTLTGKVNFTGTATKNWNIAPKNITGASVALKEGTQTYTGQKLTNAVTDVTVDNLHLGNGDYTVSGKTEATDVGNYTLTVTGKGNFTGSASQDWAILQATDNVWTVEPNVTDCTYGETPTVTMGEAKYGAVTVNYTTKDGNTSFGETVPTDAGSYQAVFTVAGTVNYNDLRETVDFTISKKTLTVTAEAKTAIYGDAAPAYTVTYQGFATSEDESKLGGTLAFACDYAPGKDVGSYDITPKGLSSDNYEIDYKTGTLTVGKREIQIQWSGAALTYNGKNQAPVATVANPFGTDVLTLEVTGGQVNAGDYKATVEKITGAQAGNYTLPENCSTRFVIHQATPTVTPPSANTLTYNGTAQTLAKDGSTDGGTLVYSLEENGTYSETIPTGIEAGDYTVWYKVQGNNNYMNTQAQGVNVTIARKDISDATVTLGADLTYNGEELTKEVKTVTVEGLNVTYEVTGNTGTNAGDYTMTLSGTENFTGTTTASWSIAQKSIQGATVSLGDKLIYSGEDQTQNIASVTVSGVTGEVTYKVTGNTGKNARTDYTMTLEGTSNFTGKKEVTWSIGKRNIANAKITLGNSLIYNGKTQIQDVASVTVQGVYAEITYTVTGNTGTDAKDYTMTLTGTGNFTGEAFATWKIQAADNDWIKEPSVTNWTYGDAPKVNVGKPKFGSVNVKYFTHDGEALGSTVPTDAGNYQVCISADANDNCYPLDKTLEFTISKKALTVTAEDKTVAYGDDAPDYTVTYKGFVEGENESKLGGPLTFTCDYAPGKDVGSYDITPKGLSSDNYEIDYKTGTLTVGKREIQIQWSGAALTYNGKNQAPVATVANPFGTDVLTLEVTGGQVNAGDYKATVEKITGAQAGNYTLPENCSTRFVIHQATPTVTPPSANTLTYNGTAQTLAKDGSTDGGTLVYSLEENGTYSETIPTGIEAGDYTVWYKVQGNNNYMNTQAQGVNVTIARKDISDATVTLGADLTYNGEELTKEVKTVTVEGLNVTYEVTGNTGTNAGDYTMTLSGTENFTGTTTASWSIAQKSIQGATVSLGDKLIYSGEDQTQNIASVTVSGVTGAVTYEVTGNTGKDATDYTMTLTGTGNFTGETKMAWSIARKDVTVQDVAVASKVYDGTDNATITDNGHLSDNFDGENLTFHVGTAAYDDKNAGADKTVTFTGFRLEGSAAGNYQLTGQPEDTTASITPMPAKLTVTAKDKTYDGTLSAKLDTVTHSGFVKGDDVQLVNGTPSFVSKDKGENVRLTFTPFALTGKDAGNYALTQPTGVTARIAPRPVTVSGITAQNKTYDGNTQVTFAYEGVVLEGNVDGDKLTVTAEGAFEDANVGSKQVYITGLTLGGAEQGNYVLAERGQQTTATAAITANDRYLDLGGVDLGGDAGTVWIDGEKQPINTSGGSHMLLPEEAEFLTTYTYSQSGGGNGYPTGMKVYRFRRADTGVTLEEIPEFENLLNYAGCSIRLTGTKGIRMITGISETKRTALIGAQGLAGYTLEEYGTVVMRGVGTPTLENSHSHNFAYKKGKADPVFGRAGGMVQYTNVLVGFSLEDCKDTLTLRPYVLLKDTATGETLTLYGGCVSRSIGYIAKQNANTYQPGTAGYQYVHQIIDAVYGKTEQGGETK